MSRRHHGRSRHHGRPRSEGQPGDVALTGAPPAPAPAGPRAEVPRPAGASVPTAGGQPGETRPEPNPQPQHNGGGTGGNGGGGGCTAPQLRRFIKSRPYVPMHELRRRFGIDGHDDDVTRVELDDQTVYVGLPSREGGLLGELLRGGEIGYELSLDPRTPVVVGVYPMRPVPRG